MSAITENISFSDNIRVSFRASAVISISGKLNGELEFGDPRLQAVFQHFRNEGCEFDFWRDRVVADLNAKDAALVRLYFDGLNKNGAFKVCFKKDSVPFASFDAMSKSPVYIDASFNLPKNKTFSFCRFSCIRSVDNAFILETPLTDIKCTLYCADSFQLIFALGAPCPSKSVPNRSQDPGMTRRILAYLLKMKAVEESGVPLSPALVQWEFHDLLFHARSRQGRHNYPSGGLSPFKGVIAQAPALKSMAAKKRIELIRPTPEEIESSDKSFSQAVDQRKSSREHGIKPLSSRELGIFFYRCARVTKIIKDGRYEYAFRPYPAGGALYDIEFYALVNRNREIERGLYYYEPKNHRLLLINKDRASLDRLSDLSAASYGGKRHPEVLILLTSRFTRLAWKYRSVAYALCLKNIGVVYQNMYLTAAAMGIGACAIGGGNSDLFSDITKIGYYEEPLVGEFIIGSLPLPPG